MTYYLDDSKLVSDTAETEYDVTVLFREVLETLPEDEPVPNGLILLGILTEQLVPIEADTDEYIQIVEKNIHDTPTAAVSTQTVKRIHWLLGQVRESLDAERKTQIGQLITEAQLNRPTKKSTTSTQQKQSNTTDETKLPEKEKQSHNESSDSIGQKTSNTESTTEKPQEKQATEDAKEHNSEKQYTGHGETESQAGNVVECEFCNASFRSESDAMSHSIRCDQRPSDSHFRCEHCGNKYVSEGALRKHLNDCDSQSTTETTVSTTPTPVYDCETCGNEFESPQELIAHNASCSESRSQSKHSTDTTGKVIERDATGTVVNYIDDDGYGFINTFNINQQDDSNSSNSVDVFFHVSEYPGHQPQKQERLQFDIKRTEDGYKAINISRGRRRAGQWDDTFASKRPRWGKDT